MDLTQLTTFFGWCTVLNFGIFAFLAIYVMLLRGMMVNLHTKMFGVAEGELPAIYFKYLAYTQAIIIPTSLVPWIALKLM